MDIKAYMEKKANSSTNTDKTKTYNIRGFVYVDIQKEKELINEFDYALKIATNNTIDLNAKGGRKLALAKVLLNIIEQHNKQKQTEKPK